MIRQTFATPGRHDVPLRQIQQGRRLPDRAYKAAEGASGAKLHVDMSDSLVRAPLSHTQGRGIGVAQVSMPIVRWLLPAAYL